jgi:DNA-binding CsgD family transcriptional regulator
VLVRLREDFSAAAVATLSAIAPHLASALRMLVALNAQRLQAALAQSALARLGIGQIALDAGGRVMAADPAAEAILSFTPEPEQGGGRRLALLPEAARAVEQACAALAANGDTGVQVVRIDARRGIDLLLRRAGLHLFVSAARPQIIGVLRTDSREDPAAGAQVLQAVHGLSPREAALAQALSCGEPLVEAGKDLGLTVETTRNYSKRIYGKTGASGQADLVRMVLTGLAPLA